MYVFFSFDTYLLKTDKNKKKLLLSCLSRTGERQFTGTIEYDDCCRYLQSGWNGSIQKELPIWHLYFREDFIK